MILTLPSSFISSLLIAATVPACQVQSLLPTVRAQQPAQLATALTEASLLTLCREGDRLRAIINSDLLETDFVLRTPAAAMVPAFTDDVNDPVTVGSVTSSAASLASGALQLQRAGDSLVLLEYTNTVHGQLRYRRRDVMPILGVTAAQGLMIDAAPLWAAVGSRMAGDQLHILRLPKQAMQPRIYDPRVRFMNTGQYIHRWRLEKKDPAARVSDVVRPIVFRLSENIPPAWVPCIKRSIEKWNPVFEAIGFRNAIVVRLAADTATTDGGEVEVRWNATDGGKLGGDTDPAVDPRTGELLGGTITLYEKFIGRAYRNALLRGELDPRTPLPFPDSMAPLLFNDVIIHEAGHAVGLDHNFKASGVYPTDSLRRPSFLRRMGVSASVMAYATGDYVAQPKDGVTFLDRRAGIGLYDRWTIAWGYRPIPEATTAEAEGPILEQWRAVQDTTPYLQSSLGHPGLDPTDQPFTEGDDPVKSSDYGLRNLTRLVAALDPKRDTVVETHPRPFSIAESWDYRMTIAASVVGGVTPQAPYPADLTKLHVLPIDSAHQVHAMQFVLAHTFYGQDDLIAKYVLGIAPVRHPSPLVLFDSVAYGWYAEQWQTYQKALLTQLVKQLADPLLSAQVGLHTALCQDIATLEKRLSTAADSPKQSSEHAKALYAIVAAAFAADGACH